MSLSCAPPPSGRAAHTREVPEPTQPRPTWSTGTHECPPSPYGLRAAANQERWVEGDLIEVRFETCRSPTGRPHAAVPVEDWDTWVDHNGMFAHLHGDPGASADLWSAWDEATAEGAPLDPATVLGSLDLLEASLAPAAARDEAWWGETYRTWPAWADRGDLCSSAEERASARAWVEARPATVEAAHP